MTLPEANPTIMSAASTADYLANAVGGKMTQWVIWLANDRKANRVKRLLPPMPGPGRPRYLVEDVDAYIDRQRTQSLVKQGQSEAVTPSGARFAAHISALKVDDGADEPSVLLVSLSPLVSYKLSAVEARRVAERLMKAADESEPTGADQVN